VIVAMAALIVAFISVLVTSGAGGGMGSGGDVPSGFQGRWQGVLSSSRPGYLPQRVEVELHSGGLNQVVGQMYVETSDCTFIVYLAGDTGAALRLNLVATDPDYCVPQASAEVELDSNLLRMTRTGGESPLRSGVLSPARA
jgi:hypothetical protein